MLTLIRPVLVALALFLLVVFVPRGPTAAGADTQESLAERAFLALQADDFSIFEPAAVSGEDIEATFQHAKGGEDAARRRADQRGGVALLAAQAKRRIEASFAEARRKGSDEIDWRKARFGGVDPQHTTEDKVGGVPMFDVEFFVQADGKQIPVRLQQVIQGKDALVLVGGFLFRPIREGTPEDEAVKLLQHTSAAIQMHRAIHKELPASLDVLRKDEGHIGKPLLTREPRDPWGRPIFYRVNDDGTFFIASYGPDGVPDTGDDIQFLPR